METSAKYQTVYNVGYSAECYAGCNAMLKTNGKRFKRTFDVVHHETYRLHRLTEYMTIDEGEKLLRRLQAAEKISNDTNSVIHPKHPMELLTELSEKLSAKLNKLS